MNRRFALLTVAAALAARAADSAQLQLSLSDERIAVHGLAWWAEDRPVMTRLPTSLKPAIPPKVWSLAQSPAGVRVRFATDSNTVSLTADGTTVVPPAHVTPNANGGVDLYVDGTYRGSAAPDKTGKLAKTWFTGRVRARHEIEIYLPVGRPLAIQSIGLADGAQVWPARSFAVAKPVVFYGSSITQGSAASNAGATYLAMLGRWLDFDFVNLGFSGNGMGEPALAEAMAEINAACYVVDFWANPTTATYRENLPRFLDLLRAKRPRTPIIVTGPYYNPSEDVPGEAGERQIQKRAFGREHVQARIAAGDALLTYVDGEDMISRAQADGLADGRHANTLGFYYCARGLEPALRKALGLPPRSGAARQ